MILVNIDYLPEKKIDILGMVKGSTVQSKHLGKDIGSMFKTLVGGELIAYSDMINEARALATKKMVEQAEELGADAIINIRYSSSTVMSGAAEVLVYGTAVKTIES
ncbi:MAG: YbjQ family protein [Eubacteriaceae bacterium]